MPYDPQAHAAAARAGGYWLDTTFDAYLAQAVGNTPDKLAVTAYRADRPEPRRLTYRELGDSVARCAAALRRLGVGRGDVVAVQLPNWWEFAVVTLAGWRVGAIVNPLMPIFRERELEFMLGFAEAKLLVVPKTFRGHDHEAMARDLQEKLPHLRHV
ncbi:MAG: cyclohexanecarboxylate-CoA ligase, partial [Ramlibacter sp.]|nr:cyclohexanecarboxylate-CoA ligase [Ramlibacter sp.]